MKPTKMPPVHPGEILLGDFMEPLGLTQYALAKALGVPALRISQIVRGQRAISADTALRLSRYFGTRPEWWLDLQTHHDLELARDNLEVRIARTVRPRVELQAA
ncbi:MAG: HigA family addiction module antitoxin [Limisphaerales bacterium]